MAKTLRSSRHQRLIEILATARRRAGLTQAVLAQRLGRPQSFVAKYENGERGLDVIEFIDIAAAMGERAEDMIIRVAGSAGDDDGSTVP